MSNHPELILAAQRVVRVYTDFLDPKPDVRVDEMLTLDAAIAGLAQALTTSFVSTPWQWFVMSDPAIKDIKMMGTRILVFVPRKVLPKGAMGQHLAFHPPKLAFARWATTLVDTPAARSSRHAQTLLDKHGGFWAADKRGIKPIKGEPELWAYLPDIGT